MRIYLQSLNKYSKLVRNCIDTGQQITMSLYVDFNNQYFYFSNATTNGRLKFKYEGEKPENIYVDTTTFLNLANSFEYLDIEQDDKKLVFKNGKDIFKPAQFIQRFDSVDFDISENVLTLDNHFNSLLKRAANYLHKEIGSPQNGVFIRDSKMISTNGREFFEGNLEITTDEEYALPDSLVKILSDYAIENTQLSQNETSIMFSSNSELTISHAKYDTLKLPPVIGTDQWLQMYDHKDYINFDRDTLIDVVKFLDPFASTIVNNIVTLSIADDTMFTVNDKNSIIKKSCICEDVSDSIKGRELKISLASLKLAIDVLPKTKEDKTTPSNVILQVNLGEDEKAKGSPAMNLKRQSKEGVDDDRVHIVFCRFKSSS